MRGMIDHTFNDEPINRFKVEPRQAFQHTNDPLQLLQAQLFRIRQEAAHKTSEHINILLILKFLIQPLRAECYAVVLHELSCEWRLSGSVLALV